MVAKGDWKLGQGHVMQGTAECDEQKWIWEMRLISEIQEDEVELVARSDWSRCTEPLAIAHRSLVWRTVRSGRGYSHRSGACLRQAGCQGDARE
jgi:hypothetical protein